MKNLKYIILIGVIFISCNSKQQKIISKEEKLSKYLIEKTLYWNHNVNLIESTNSKAEELLLEYEQKMFHQPGTLNFLANEDLDKHRELTSYLSNSLGIINKFNLNGLPYILADFGLSKDISLEATKEILEILGKQVYRIKEIDKSQTGKYCLIYNEDMGFENFQSCEIYDSFEQAQDELTKQLSIQIAYYRPQFVDVEESHSKTEVFNKFKNGLKHFNFFDGYLIFQPNNETIEKLDKLNHTELMEIKDEIDRIIQYSGKRNVYKIEKI